MTNSLLKVAPRFLCFILFALALILACGKDHDEPYDAVDNTSANKTDYKGVKLTAKAAETRTTDFNATQDAYVQSGKGYDQKIVRLEDGRRKSYLMFDLREIDSNGGSLISADLEFTISSDGGDGTISVFRGKADNWSEDKLSASSAPAAETLLGKATDQYEIGQTKKIALDESLLNSGIITLVMIHKDGNDLAFASKEHPDENGPKLIVSYETPTSTDTDSVTTDTDENEEETEIDDADKPIAAKISATIPSSNEVPLTIDFKAWNSKNQKDISGYFWDFKDGSTTAKKNPTHTFTKAGNYSVELTVKNDEGFTDSTTLEITIGGASQNNDESSDETDTGSDTDSDTGSSSGSESINVAAVISGAIPSSAQAPTTIDFKAYNSKNQKDITGYFWDFNDGSTTTKKNPTHTFTKPGNFTVQLSVKNSAGQTHSVTRDITITATTTNSGSGSSNGGSGSSSGSSGNSGSSSSGSGSNGSGNNGSSNNSGNSGNHPSNAVFASSFGFRSGDATAAFKAAINSGSSYVVIDKQSSDWVIQPTRFFNLRNMTIVFESGVTVRAKSGAFGSDGARLIQLTNAENITIEGGGATLRMNKSEYNSGEQRHGLDIDRGKNITVRGLTIRDTGGDGVHIKGNGSSEYSENITLENIKSTNNKRDGIGIVSAQDVWVRNSEFLQTSGKRPEAGVVLECDRPTERLVNINFIGCKFSGNGSAGFHFSTTKMNSSSRPVSIKVVDCEFRNNIVSPNGQTTEVYIGGGRGNDIVGGEIRFERVKFNGSSGRIIFTRKSASGFRAVFKDCEATNVVSSSSVSPIRLEAHEDRSTLGGIVFENFEMAYSRDVPFMTINAPSKGGSFDLKDVRGTFQIDEPNDNSLRYSGGYRSDKNVNVSISYNHN